MKVEYIGQNEKFSLKDWAVRKTNSYCSECEKHYPADQFQALVKDKRRKKDKSVSCQLRFESESEEFLGLEQQTIYTRGTSNELAISMQITVPDLATKAIVLIEEEDYTGFEDRWAYVAGAVLIVVCVFAIKGLFNW